MIRETPETLLPLSSSERIVEEMIIGVYPLSETENPTVAALQAMSKATVLRGTNLCVPMPAGKQVSDPAPERQITSELRQFLGGWFQNDLTSFIDLRDDFYYLGFSTPPWQVQCLGVPGDFHAVFIAHLMKESEALGAGGHPRIRPLGEVDSLLEQVAPRIAERSLTDRTTEHSENVFDTYLTNDRGVVVKAGVRMRLTETGAAFPGPEAYFYGIRVNLEIE